MLLALATSILMPLATADAGEPAYRVKSTSAAEIAGIGSLTVSRDGKLVATAGLWGTAQVWDWRHARIVSSLKVSPELIENLFFLDDDRRLAVLYSEDIDQHMYVWEMSTGDVADEEKVVGLGTGYPMPDGTFGLQNESGVIFVDQNGKRVADRFVDLGSYMSGLALSPDGQLIAGGGSGQHYAEFVIHDAQGKFLKAIDTGFAPADLVFSPDSKSVAVMQQENGGLGNPAEFDPSTNAYDLYDVATGKKLQRFGGHDLFLSGARFSPDGSQFLTWSGDRTLILWDVETGKMIHRLKGHRDSVSDAQFLDNGSLVVSCSLDGSMKIWSADAGREIVSMHALGVQTEPSPSFISLMPDGHFIEDGPVRLEIVRVQDAADGAPLTDEERAPLKLPAMEIVAD